MAKIFKTVMTDKEANELSSEGWKLELVSHKSVRNDLEQMLDNGYYDWLDHIKLGYSIEGSFAGSSKVITVYTFSKTD